MQGQAFSPLGDNVSVVGGVASVGAALPGAQGAAQTIRVYNGANGVAFVRWGNGAQTAVATDTFVAPGATEVFSIPGNVTEVAAILPVGAGSITFQRGAGM
jgi:hypothetical protein